MVENTSQRPNELHLIGAMSDGPSDYITGMEAAGQRQLVASSVLPAKMHGGREAYEALGFTFGAAVPGDELFIEATLPAGWEKRGSDHDMWSYIYDAEGQQRVAVFYKAAFYDRKASMHIVRTDT